jgi:putative membrane protein
MSAVSAFPPFHPHVEVWILIAGVAALGLYVDRVIQPRAVAAGHPPISSHQKRWFWLGLALLWFASDWPLHDISELRLYSAHMFQHMLITVVIPPIFLLAVPEWLGRLIVGKGRFSKVFYWVERPLPAAVLFNVLAVLTHWTVIVTLSVQNGPFHYMMHTLLFTSGVLMWMLICGPFPELHLSEPGKMIYIFVMSLIPTIPAAFLTASDGVIYRVYAHVPRLWFRTALEDQQFAGVVMKLIEGTYLWGIIMVLFFRWMRDGETKEKYRGRLVPSGSVPGSSSSSGPGTGSGAG